MNDPKSLMTATIMIDPSLDRSKIDCEELAQQDIALLPDLLATVEPYMYGQTRPMMVS